MPDQNPGTIKYQNNRKHINIGLIICILVILYFVAFFCYNLFNSSDDLYEVVKGTSSSRFDGQYTALLIRSESVVESGSEGYVNYFVGDATPVYVGEQIYLIDSSGELSNRLKEAARTLAILNENDLTQIKNAFLNFRTSFSENSYYEAYHFKYQVESQILDLINESVFSSDNLDTGTYSVCYSDLAGILMHYVDGFESLTTDNFEASSFSKNNYKKTIIRSNDHINAGDPVYKVITSDNWYLVIQISDPEPFKDLDVISFEFLKDGVSANAGFELITRGGNYYGILSLNKYMIRYANDRYTQISITNDRFSGLMVPKTAVTKCTFFAVPKEFMTKDGESFAVKVKGPDGNETINIRTPDIIAENDELCYISTSDEALAYGDVLIKEDSDNEFSVGMTADLEGVYVYNIGSVSFRLIDILGENNGYYIIDENTVDGVQMYDQIYSDYKDAEE